MLPDTSSGAFVYIKHYYLTYNYIIKKFANIRKIAIFARVTIVCKNV